ncbi:hypothetical protein [Bacillus cereus group sp. BfR-BA-01523]|nr:hypothetical protein [Bacillus cereus group sp. BfR-BA-01523]
MFQTIIYDKAKYHYEGDFPQELPMEQAFVHTDPISSDKVYPSTLLI